MGAAAADPRRRVPGRQPFFPRPPGAAAARDHVDVLASGHRVSGHVMPESSMQEDTPAEPAMLARDVPAATARADTDVVLRVRDLRKSYGANEVVRGLSFAIRRGECFGLLGPNGAGKT